MEYSNLVDVKKHEMFPTVIHSFSLDIDDYDMKNMTTYIKSNQKKVDLYQTEDDLHITSFFRPLYIKILEVNEKILDELGYEYEGLSITSMWGNIMRAGATHPPHTHSNNFLSGVVYLDAGNKTAPIQFFDPRPQASVMVPRRKTNTIYNSNMIEFEAETYKGFIFPSWLMHWVKTNDEERMSVSWNIQVNGHYGEPKTLQNAYIKEK